ncbi:MAG: nucleotidyltransferase family protein [Candidatus Brocadiales bacterium]|nr:nucleotidyltransferase family protein [Candidatus Brocadiales bacterium]
MNESTIKRYIARFLNLKIGEENVDEIWNKLESTGWNDIINVAEEHRVITFLFYKIKHLGLEEKLKPETLRIMSIIYHKGVARNVVTRHVLKEIISSFNQCGIKAIILKGAINFCENIYENWNLRSMEDLDILINEKDFPAARQCMKTAGLRYIGGQIPRDLSEDFEGRDIAIDMHYLPVPEKHIDLFDMDSFWSNTMCVEMDGIKTHIPSPTDQIYHKFVHDVIRHQELVNFQIQDLYDFIMTSKYYKERIDWEEILRRVRKNDIESLFKFHCWQIKRNLGTELPQPINYLSDNTNKYYKECYDQLSECPEWLESASERLMAIMVKGGNIFAHLKNSFNVLVKESALKESRELLLSLYHIKGGKLLLPFIRTIHLFRILFLHIMIIAYLAKQRLSTHK